LQKTRVFDTPHYRLIDEARISLFRELLPQCAQKLDLRSALDAGCGVGHFSGLLRDLHFRTMGFDGRIDNVEEARRRYPDVEFRVGDVEDPGIERLGSFDLVLCVGLLYHLENPFRAIRNISRLTSRLLLIESMCTGEKWPLLRLREEGSGEDQGLRYIAFYPSEACLIKMLYRSGFTSVYRFTRLPEHPDFRQSWSRQRMRTLLAASSATIDLPFLDLVTEPGGLADPLATRWAKFWGVPRRIVRFAVKPWSEKAAALRRRLL
jgi:SAM-dependent methyltransferase